MLMILARLVRSESFWAVAKVRSPHTGPGISYIIFRQQPLPLRHRDVGPWRIHDKSRARPIQGLLEYGALPLRSSE